MMVIFSVPSMAQYTQKDTSSLGYTYKAALCLEKGGRRQSLAMVATLCGGLIVAGGVSNNGKNNSSSAYFVAGGALAVIGIVLYVSGSSQIASAGKYLQYATGHFPINYRRK